MRDPSTGAGTRSAAGLTSLDLHHLCHFYASGLIAAGCDVVTVQRALGHSSPTTTLKTYAHLWPSAEERTRNASEGMMTTALSPVEAATTDSVRTEGRQLAHSPGRMPLITR
jgi:hypothetical protein